MSAAVDPAFGHWLAGFIDGEGSFNIAALKKKGGVSHVTRFHLGLRVDDRAILDEIVETVGFGSISVSARFNRPDRRGGDQAAWNVYRKDECLLLVQFLDQFPLRAKKRADFEVWKRAVLHRSSVGYYRDQAYLAALREELHAGRRYVYDESLRAELEAVVA